MRLDPLPEGLLDPELDRRLKTALEFEGWQEAETIYGEIYAALSGSDPVHRARVMMDHAAVLRRLGKVDEAVKREGEAEKLVGAPVEREADAPSSVDELVQARQKKAKSWFGKLFG